MPVPVAFRTFLLARRHGGEPALAAAFVWRRFDIGAAAPLLACCLVTVPANQLIATDGMPAFIAPEDWETWLCPYLCSTKRWGRLPATSTIPKTRRWSVISSSKKLGNPIFPEFLCRPYNFCAKGGNPAIFVQSPAAGRGNWGSFDGN